MAHRRVVKGFTDLGTVRVPPLPTRIVLIDRADGTFYALLHDGTSSDRIALDSLASRTSGDDIRIFAAFDGPVINAPNPHRLLVRNGALGYEEMVLTSHLSDRDEAPVLCRRDNESKLFEIKQGVGWVTGDALAYEQTVLP